MLHGRALGESSSDAILKYRIFSFKRYVDHLHTMHSSGNIDVRNWVQLFESPSTLLCIEMLLEEFQKVHVNMRYNINLSVLQNVLRKMFRIRSRRI